LPSSPGLDAIPLSPQTESVELVTLAQFTITTYGVVLRTLMVNLAEDIALDEA
jgi:hypothetical protein